MRKLLLIAVALLVFTGAQAQSRGDNAVGLNLVVGTGDLDNVGLGLKYQYNITAPLRIEPTMTFFFEKNYTTAWDLMANVHYILPIAQDFNIYPLAGIGLQHTKIDIIDFKSTDFQFNIGCGAEYWFSSNWAGLFEFKYKLSNYDFANFVLGAAYKF